MNDTIEVKLYDIDYIPSYKMAEADRKANEIERIANEEERINYINDLKNRVASGEFDGEKGEQGPQGPQGPQGEKGEGTQYSAGEGVEITEENVLNILKATSETLGGIKVGENLSIDENGVLNVTGISRVVDSITAIHSNVDKYIEDLEEGKLYYLTGGWILNRESFDGGSDVNFKTGYIGYVVRQDQYDYYDYFKFVGVSVDSSEVIKLVEITDIYGTPSLTYGSLRKPNDTLTCEYADTPLSAKQGKVLKGFIDNLQEQIDNIPTSGGDVELPIATADTLGGIKVGENLSIDVNGVLNAISSFKMYVGTDDNPVYLNQLGYGIFLTKGVVKNKEGSNNSCISTPVIWFITETNCMYISIPNSTNADIRVFTFTYSDITGSGGNLGASQYCTTYIHAPINNLTTTTAWKSLSASQGKALNDRLKTVESNYNKKINWYYGTSSSAQSLYYLGSGIYYVGNYIKQNDKTSIQKIDRPMLLLMDGSTMAVGLSIDMSTGDLYTHTLPSAGNSSSSSTTINTKKIGCTVEDSLASGSTTNVPSINAVNNALVNYQSKVLSGTSDPTSDIGNDGDVYFQYTE